MADYVGNKIKFGLYGSSHGPCVGVVAIGFEKGFEIDKKALAAFMERRAPGKSRLTTGRKEEDKIIFRSGVTKSILDGNDIRMEILNTDVKKKDYDDLKYTPRPGTSDYVAMVKYGLSSDRSGSGQFSGRMTAPMCALGGIVLQILEKQGIEISSKVVSVGNSKNPEEFDKIIEEAKKDGDSVGSVVECRIKGVAPGAGDIMFDSIESTISRLIFGIPGIKGIEFGSGFYGASLRGSENNDQLEAQDGNVRFLSNNAGGILGGLANGDDIVFRVAFKPTPSIGKKQKTVDMMSMENREIEISGRHDPCIGIRGAVVVEAIAAIAIYDIL